MVAICACNPGGAPVPNVRIDHRVETVAMLERLAGAHEYSEATGPYVAEVDRALAPFANHPAVVLARSLHAHGLAYERPMQLALHAEVESTETLEPFSAAIDQFAAAAKLDAFFAAHAAYYASVEAAFRGKLAVANPIRFFRGLVPDVPRFTLIPALLQGPQNYGVHVGNNAYQLMGLGEVDAQGLPKAIDGDLIVHEMAHSFVNPVIAEHQELWVPAAKLLALVEPQMAAQAYATPKILLDESIVRAVTVHYVRTTRGDAAADKAIRGEIRRGFLWTRELEAVIAAGGKRDFAARIGELSAFFTATAAQYANGLPAQPFAGPIDAVYRKPFAIVASPATLDQARQVAATIFHGAPAVGDTAPPHTGVVAYGSATTPAIAAALAKLNITVTADAISIGAQRFTGAELGLIACTQRYDDAMQGLAIYTAATDAGVAGINELHAGSTDWVVGQRVAGHWQVVASGDF